MYHVYITRTIIFAILVQIKETETGDQFVYYFPLLIINLLVKKML